MKFKNDLLSFEFINKDILYILLAVVALFYYPVIFGHGVYVDDLYRIQDGQFAWMMQARPLAELIARIYTLSRSSIVDPTPFNWGFGIVFIALSAKLIYLRFSHFAKIYALPLSVIFIINPYFIQNMLYRFDSIGMVLALFFAVMSFCINDKYKSLKILSMFLSFNFYQPMSNVFIGLMAIEVLLMFRCKESYIKILRFIISLMTIFVVTNAIYFIEVKLFFPAAQGRSTVLPLDYLFFRDVFWNYYHALLPYLMFWGKYFAFIVPVIILTSISIIKTVLIDRDTKMFFGYIVSFIIVIFSSLGFMVIMKYQMYITEVRAYTYFPITLMFMAIAIINWTKSVKWMWLFFVPIFFACFIFSAHVGNLQRLQSEFEKPIFYALTVDLDKMHKQYDVDKFYSIGNVPYSKFVENTMVNTPFNGYLSRYGWHTTAMILEYGNKYVPLQFDAEYVKGDEIFQKNKKFLGVGLDSPYYTIYIDKNQQEGWIIWKNLWL